MGLTIERNRLYQLNDYDLSKDRYYASLFVIGNGYFNIRGSFEEDSEIGTQGLFIRGYIDKTIEPIVPFYQSEFLKKNYYNDDNLRDWQDTECGINPFDPLSIIIKVDNNIFSMCDGIIKSYERDLNYASGEYIRTILWDDGEGRLTKFIFKRFASFKNKNLLAQKVIIERINHNKEITILSGIDTRVKTMGQNVTKVLKKDVEINKITVQVSSGDIYGFISTIIQENRVIGEKVNPTEVNYKNQPFVEYKMNKDFIEFEKMSFITTSRDNDLYVVPSSYENELSKHLEVYKEIYDNANVVISGNDEIDAKLRFSVYHTIISMSYHDGIHGVGAKGLTGEGYHQFVWWDSEIYQMPFFLYTNPIAAKNSLIYRYNMLKKSKEIAAKLGYKGARFAFCSSVTGEEKVWSFAVHPFMQDHIVADVIYSLYQYFFATQDLEFMNEMGIEILSESIKYWLSRTIKTNRGYEIHHLTGPDEHHWDVNNDAYTNYLVKYCFNTTLELIDIGKLDIEKFNFTSDEYNELKKQATGLYISPSKNGYIPQFDGYFDLSLKMDSNIGSGVGPQMRYKGSYLKSQIIKQPDVLLLYSYVDVIDNHKDLIKNLDHYEKECECSSSLSYAPHAICCALAERMNSFLDYLDKTISIDLLNMHGGVENGVHSGCEAGGYLSILFGLFEFRNKKGILSLNPKYIPYFESVKLPLTFNNSKLLLTLEGTNLNIKLLRGDKVEILFKDEKYLINGSINLKI